MTGRVRYIHIVCPILLLVICVPRLGLAQSNHAPVPANATAIAVGKHKGHEVARWVGALDWQGPMPIEFIGRQTQKKWSWQPHEPEELQIQASLEKPRVGIEIQKWARAHGATWVQVIIVPAGTVSTGTQPHGGGHTANGTGARADDDDDDDDDTNTAAAAGLGEQGTGSGRGLRGDQAYDGTGTDQGREGGSNIGSDDPSWYDNHRAELVTEHGGRTPGDGGRQGGSAAGEQGGPGNTLGLGLWGGLLDAPEAVAPLVNAGLILADANFTHFSQKFLSRVVRGLGARAVRKELAKEAAQVVARDLTKVRNKLARSPNYRSLPVREQEAIVKRAEQAMTRAYYKKAQAHFTRDAERNAALAATYSARKDDVGKHFTTLSTENEAAYREMAQAARENLEHAESMAKAQEEAARKAAKTAEKQADKAGKKLDKTKRAARAKGPLQGKGGLRWLSKSRVVFEGKEVRAVRDLAHMSDSDLHKIADTGKSATDPKGNTLNVHHMEQKANGSYYVEISSSRHNVHNKKQHPKGNEKGRGLTAEERAEFDKWRTRYWRARARDELGRRGIAR